MDENEEKDITSGYNKLEQEKYEMLKQWSNDLLSTIIVTKTSDGMFFV